MEDRAEHEVDPSEVEDRLKALAELGILVPPQGELEPIEPLVTPKQSVVEILIEDRKR